MGCSWDDPRSWVSPKRWAFDVEEIKYGSALYVGAGAAARGLRPSVWAASLPKSGATSKAAAMEQYEAALWDGDKAMADIPLLEGRRLMCHCGPKQPCHIDVLVKSFDELKAAAIAALLCLLPSATDEQALASTAGRIAALPQSRMGRATLGRQRPARRAGQGEPIRVGHGNTERVLADGCGPCSPGLRPPERRQPPTGIAAKLFDALAWELNALDASRTGGLSCLVGDLIAGKVAEDPFSAGADCLAAVLHGGDCEALSRHTTST